MDTIRVGSRVRSYDFEGREDCYMEGVVEAIGAAEGFHDCDRYTVRVDRRVWGGKEDAHHPLAIAEKVKRVYPPVNGTPTRGGRITDRVKLIGAPQPTPWHCYAMLGGLDSENLGPRVYQLLWGSECQGDKTVIVSASYNEEDVMTLDGAEAITEYDAEGSRLIRVPVRHLVRWYDEDEYRDLMVAYDADERMLSYAR